MDSLDTARQRIERATDLPAVLDASYRAFATMLAVIEQEEDRGGPLFPAFVLAGVPASSGRFALAGAPSLPVSARTGQPTPIGLPAAPADQTAAGIAKLSQLLALRLDEAALNAERTADRHACTEAARQAWALQARLGKPRLT
jgi:hypothetical protein